MLDIFLTNATAMSGSTYATVSKQDDPLRMPPVAVAIATTTYGAFLTDKKAS